MFDVLLLDGKTDIGSMKSCVTLSEVESNGESGLAKRDGDTTLLLWSIDCCGGSSSGCAEVVLLVAGDVSLLSGTCEGSKSDKDVK